MHGFSRANLLYMRAFAEAWPDPTIVQRVVGRLPWGQNIELLTKLKDPTERLWYAEATLEHGWSRPVLATQIQTQLRDRQGKAITNFDRALPPEASDLAQQVVKDPYQFDFMALAPDIKERDLERALVARVKDLLLEMGKGFAFIGSQHHLEAGGEDWYVDLLFYHRRLRCLVAVDLKTGAFQPEHAGKMNFYLAALDERDREPGDNPSIGLILCRQRNRVVVEYALRSVTSPIGVAEYKLMVAEALPAALAEALPTPEDLEPGMTLLPRDQNDDA
jgi:predicted nuclease of restriction endonuclease-like (RecB) superfamily